MNLVSLWCLALALPTVLPEILNGSFSPMDIPPFYLVSVEPWTLCMSFQFKLGLCTSRLPDHCARFRRYLAPWLVHRLCFHMIPSSYYSLPTFGLFIDWICPQKPGPKTFRGHLGRGVPVRIRIWLWLFSLCHLLTLSSLPLVIDPRLAHWLRICLILSSYYSSLTLWLVHWLHFCLFQTRHLHHEEIRWRPASA